VEEKLASARGSSKTEAD